MRNGSESQSQHAASGSEPETYLADIDNAGLTGDDLVDTGWSIQPLNFATETARPTRETAIPDAEPQQILRSENHPHQMEDITPLFPDTPPSFPPARQHSTRTTDNDKTEETPQSGGASQESVQDHRSYLNDASFISILAGTEENLSDRQPDSRYHHSHKATKKSSNKTLSIVLGAVAVIVVACVIIVLAQ
ncbi:hypothetical protein [Bifidobacterium aquikefiricola]|uniref:Uncharacterized protein n=2 Tax=Bifidobacterium TaxID=1678 RepID=A0AB39U551_9BIFI